MVVVAVFFSRLGVSPLVRRLKHESSIMPLSLWEESTSKQRSKNYCLVSFERQGADRPFS